MNLSTFSADTHTVPDPQACYQCGRILHKDEIALHKRIINRGATKHLCITCLAAYFNCSEDLLREKIAHFRQMGCTLFETKAT